MTTWLLSWPAIMCWTAIVVTVTLVHLRFGWKGFYLVFVAGMGSLYLVYTLISIPLPADISLTGAAEVLDRHGRSIGTYDETRRFVIDAARLPQHVQDAVIAAEDKDFLTHGGIAYKGLLRAAIRNLTRGRIEQGGSTITQQYVKVALLRDGSRNLVRKIKEAALASKLEDRYTKDQILSFYLNTIYFGRGNYGIEAAARTYFDKHAVDLSLTEAAYLAGIIRAPEAYQIDRAPDAAETRYRQVIGAMEEQDLLGERKAKLVSERLPRYAKGFDNRATEQTAAYFLEWLRRGYLEEAYGDCLHECGLKIHTTLDLKMQHAAEVAVKKTLNSANDPQAALVAMTPGGAIRALVGGRDVQNLAAASGFNFATDLPGREAGSTFKPFTLAAALSQGVSAWTAVSGASPARIDNSSCNRGSRPWYVNNYGGASYGTMSLSTALTHSVNTVFARVSSMIGPASIAEIASDLGFNRAGTSARRNIPPNCSLSLGSIDVTPMELTRAYAAFAAGGVLPPARAITYIETEDGTCLISFARFPADCDERVTLRSERVLGEEVTTVVTEAMRKAIALGTGRAADIGMAAAGKTGTSQNNRDAWFAGYVPQLVAGVWVGYPLNDQGIVPEMRRCKTKGCSPVRGAEVTGGTIPAQIWQRFMSKVLIEEKEEVAERDGTPGPDLEEASEAPGNDGSSPRPAAPPPPKPTPSPSESNSLIPLIDELPNPDRFTPRSKARTPHGI